MTGQILIVDDHAIVRDALAKSLQKLSAFEILPPLDNGEAVLAFGKSNRFDLLLIDYNLGLHNGIEIAQKLRMENKNLKVLLFSMFAHEIQEDFHKTSFEGLIDKSRDMEDFLLAVEAIMNGKRYLIDRVYDQLDQAFRHQNVPILSDREKEVLRLLAQGKKQYDIAKELHVSLRTIEGHRERICGKLGMKSIAQLALYAARSGIYRFGSNASID